jgi:hypothetical protein
MQARSKIVRGFRGSPIKRMPCCGKKCVKTWDLEGKEVWVYLSSWNKCPIFSPGIHKRHKFNSPETRRKISKANRIPWDNDFIL